MLPYHLFLLIFSLPAFSRAFINSTHCSCELGSPSNCPYFISEGLCEISPCQSSYQCTSNGLDICTYTEISIMRFTITSGDLGGGMYNCYSISDTVKQANTVSGGNILDFCDVQVTDGAGIINAVATYQGASSNVDTTICLWKNVSSYIMPSALGTIIIGTGYLHFLAVGSGSEYAFIDGSASAGTRFASFRKRTASNGDRPQYDYDVSFDGLKFTGYTTDPILINTAFSPNQRGMNLRFADTLIQNTDGGIQMIYSSLTSTLDHYIDFVDVIIQDNILQDREGTVYFGGPQTHLTFTRGAFVNNDGGGMFLNNVEKSILITNTAFENNRAYSGGGLYLSGLTGDLVLDSVSFNANTAEEGGGMYLGTNTVTSVNSTCNHCYFGNNMATTTGVGGALAIFGDTSYTMSFPATIFASNSGNGSIVYVGSPITEDLSSACQQSNLGDLCFSNIPSDCTSWDALPNCGGIGLL